VGATYILLTLCRVPYGFHRVQHADDMSISSTCGADEIFYDQTTGMSVTNYDMLLFLDSDSDVKNHICSLIGNPDDC
jgi:hypothetical protein